MRVLWTLIVISERAAARDLILCSVVRVVGRAASIRGSRHVALALALTHLALALK